MTVPALPASHPFTTMRDLLRYAVSRFTAAGLVFGHGSENAYDEAAYLILHTLHLPLDTLEPFLDARLLPEEVAAVLQVIERRTVDRVPAAYLTHEAYMHGMRFYVDERVIVPRSFIGELLEEGLAPWLPHEDGPTDVLELCTGSGCLAILAALQWPNATLDAVDLSPDALVVAQRNVDDYGLNGCIRLHEGDLYAPLPPGVHYDVILTNPPYVNETSMQALPPNTAPSPAWRWPAAPTAWTSCAASWPTRRATSSRTACWWSRSATSARTWKPPSPTWTWSGCPPAPATIRCSWSPARRSEASASRSGPALSVRLPAGRDRRPAAQGAPRRCARRHRRARQPLIARRNSVRACMFCSNSPT